MCLCPGQYQSCMVQQRLHLQLVEQAVAGCHGAQHRERLAALVGLC